MLRNCDKLIKRLCLTKNVFYLISSSDEYLLEYVPEYNKKLKWLTNFTGSNGLAMISLDKKYFFTDGRYTEQARNQLHKSFEIIDTSEIDFLSFVKIKLIIFKSIQFDAVK